MANHAINSTRSCTVLLAVEARKIIVLCSDLLCIFGGKRLFYYSQNTAERLLRFGITSYFIFKMFDFLKLHRILAFHIDLEDYETFDICLILQVETNFEHIGIPQRISVRLRQAMHLLRIYKNGDGSLTLAAWHLVQ